MKKIKELMDLNGRVALITGGAGHIGSAIAEALAEQGAGIILLDCDEKKSKLISKRICAKYKVKSSTLNIDLNDTRALKGIPKLIKNLFGRLDILVNCAALVGTSKLKGWAVPFEKQDVETWRMAMEINLTAPFALAQICAPLLKKSKGAAVINISSIYGLVGPDMSLYAGTGMGNPAAYSASKGGLIQLTRWLSTALAPKVRVNAMTIGGVFRNHKDPFLKKYVSRTPLKRMATEEDIKGAAVFLASDLSKYMTGQNVIVDGGWTTW